MSEEPLLDRASRYVFSELERAGGDPTRLVLPLETVAIVLAAQGIRNKQSFGWV